MNSQIFFLVFTIFLTASFDYVLNCHEIQNVFMEVEDKEGEWSNITLSGCIQRSNLEGKTVRQIHVRHQNISKLGKDFVKHLIKLDTLEFQDCQIQSIAQGAFRNLPVIRHIEITYNPLKKITGGIFDVFDTIKVLRLNNNQLSSMTDEALSNMTLTEVNFSHNNFFVWKSVWFSYSPNIKILDFSFNNIQVLPEDAFKEMPSLKIINFEHNKISAIGDGTFGNLLSLDVLNLRSNMLRTINVDIFGNGISIKTFNIASNRISNIEENVLKKLHMGEILIGRNPWVCHCLTIVNQLLYNKNVKVTPADNCKLENLPICIVNDACELPLNNKGMLKFLSIIDNLRKDEKDCIGF